MLTLREVRRLVSVSLWFMLVTFPIIVIRVNTVEGIIIWRWSNALLVGAGTLVAGLVWRIAMNRRKAARAAVDASTETDGEQSAGKTGGRLAGVLRRLEDKRVRVALFGALALFAIVYPFSGSLYQTNIMITALIYVMLALGLNIVIGLGGMLHLGYIAFYAVGAYTYGILYQSYGVGFWVALPIGAVLAMVAGILLALPVLRLRGDYLAIVTLGFAEIVRILLNNMTGFSGGPGGIGGIPRPPIFGIDFSLTDHTIVIYFIVLLAVLLTVFVVWRFEHSRIGRALVAMGEDDIAAEAMGVDVTRTKLIAFALGSLWAGLGGVIFAARTTFINPASFTVWQSVIVLCCVVLGGMGSITGSILGALALILIPEYLRAFSDYRMIMFGTVLVTMMVFRPGGLIQKRRKAYTFPTDETAPAVDA